MQCDVCGSDDGIENRYGALCAECAGLALATIGKLRAALDAFVLHYRRDRPQWTLTESMLVRKAEAALRGEDDDG